MDILVKIAQFFLSLSILILLHELGHFLFAKLFKTRVEKFYLFFNLWFSIFKIKIGETEYGLGWLPLGGYCKISGMIDESMDKEQMKKPPEPHEYRSKPAWQRFFIITGGVMVNILLALFIYSMVLYTWGERYLPTKNLTHGVVCDSLALEMGFMHGDRILYVNGSEVESFHDIPLKIILNPGSVITVQRGEGTLDIPIPQEYISDLIKNPVIFTPRIPLEVAEVVPESEAFQAGLEPGDKLRAINGQENIFFDQFRDSVMANIEGSLVLSMLRDGETVDLNVQIPESGIIGIRTIANISHFYQVNTLSYSFFASFPAGAKKGVSTIKSYLKQLRLIFSPSTKAYESVGGFITIGNIFPSTWDWQSFWNLTALLSIVLAIMNILPIPALDGGHMMFIIYEMITRHKPSDKFMEYAQITGFAIVIALVLFANLNDIIKYLPRLWG